MAETNLRKIQTLIDEGRYLEKRKQPKETLKEFPERYLAWCESTKEKSYSKKKSRLTAIVEWIGKDTLLGDVTRATIEKYQAERLTKPGPKMKTVGKATINRDVSAIRHMFQKAVEWGVMTDNPLRGIKKFKETGRRLRYLTSDESALLLSKCSPLLKLVDLVTVKEILRHKDIQVTMRYSHLSPAHKKSAVNALEASLLSSNVTAVKEA
jgi:site-specific recombinase XerD